MNGFDDAAREKEGKTRSKTTSTTGKRSRTRHSGKRKDEDEGHEQPQEEPIPELESNPTSLHSHKTFASSSPSRIEEENEDCSPVEEVLRCQQISTKNVMIFPPPSEDMSSYRGLYALFVRDPHAEGMLKGDVQRMCIESEWKMKPLPGSWRDECNRNVDTILNRQRRGRYSKGTVETGGAVCCGQPEEQDHETSLLHRIFTNPVLLVPYQQDSTYHVPIFAHEVEDILRIQRSTIPSMYSFYNPFTLLLSYVFVNDAATKLFNVRTEDLRYAFETQGPACLWAEEDRHTYIATLTEMLFKWKHTSAASMQFVCASGNGQLAKGSSVTQWTARYLPTGGVRSLLHEVFPPNRSPNSLVRLSLNEAKHMSRLSQAQFVDELSRRVVYCDECCRKIGNTSVFPWKNPLDYFYSKLCANTKAIHAICDQEKDSGEDTSKRRKTERPNGNQ